jgi:hypothetical protein
MAAAARLPAVIVYGTNGTGNNNLSAPVDDPGWANVGKVDGATAIYLGSTTTGYWMLTANHVILSSGIVVLNNTSYLITGNATQIGNADIKVFRIQQDPGLPSVVISSSAPQVGASVVMIGNGRTQGAEKTWNGNPSGWGSPGSAAAGYEWGDSNVVRWGTNIVQGNSLGVVSGSTTFSTIFNDTTNPNEAQASLGDSGGAVFVKNGLFWELTGLMTNVGVWTGLSYAAAFTGQPSSVSLYSANTGIPGAGSATFSVQLANYRSAILTAIPEPSPVGSMLAAGGVLILLTVRKFTRRARET